MKKKIFSFTKILDPQHFTFASENGQNWPNKTIWEHLDNLGPVASVLDHFMSTVFVKAGFVILPISSKFMLISVFIISFLTWLTQPPSLTLCHEEFVNQSLFAFFYIHCRKFSNIFWIRNLAGIFPKSCWEFPKSKYKILTITIWI